MPCSPVETAPEITGRRLDALPGEAITFPSEDWIHRYGPAQVDVNRMGSIGGIVWGGR